MRPKNIEKEEAIRRIALQIIQEEGLENLSMQKLAKAANISPRTIYIKYEDKEDLLVKLFIDEVLGAYERAVLENFNEDMQFAEGIRMIWQNTFRYLRSNRPHFSLIQYGKSSPFLNKAYRDRNIQEGQFFSPIHRFIKNNIKQGIIINMPFQVYRSLLFAPLLDLVNEYYEHTERPKQIITEKIVLQSCEAIIKGLLV